MIVVERRRIELDYCPNCEGVWFDGGELELLLKSEGLSESNLAIGEIVKLPEIEHSTRTRKCPLCNKNMKEVAIGSPTIDIDVCVNSDGLFFDGGEMHALLKQLSEKTSAGSGEPVLDFLGDVFKDNQ